MEAVLSNSSFAYQSYKKKTMKKVQNLKPKLLLTFLLNLCVSLHMTVSLCVVAQSPPWRCGGKLKANKTAFKAESWKLISDTLV